jgi:hypothetical protein
MVVRINMYFLDQHLTDFVVKGEVVAFVCGRKLNFKYSDELQGSES